MRSKLINISLIVLFLAAPGAVFGAGWGSIKGRFVVDGQPPERPPLKVEKDAFCIEANPENQSLIVGENGGLANVVVYLRVPRRGDVAIHPDYEKQLKETPVLDNQGCEFEPHVTLVRVGQTLLVKNSDPVGHNTNLVIFGQNPTVPAKSEVKVQATKESPLPTPVLCNIHPFMQGHVLCQKHPYMAATSDDGAFEIKNLPAGKHEFQLWHEAPGYLKNLQLAGNKTDSRGRVELTIADGETLDLGEVKIPASLLRVR